MPTRRSQCANRSIRVSHRVFVEDSHSPGLYERIDRADRPVRLGFDGHGSSPSAWRAEPHGGWAASGSSQQSRPTIPLRGSRGAFRRLAACSVSTTEQAALDLLSCQLRALERAVVDAGPATLPPKSACADPCRPAAASGRWTASAAFCFQSRSGHAARLCKRLNPALGAGAPGRVPALVHSPDASVSRGARPRARRPA
jgi:hypothetical protein